MKYTLDSICGPPVVKRGPDLKPKLTGIDKQNLEPETLEEEFQRVFRVEKEK